ncbi:tyrosine-type recombinase/integrase [Nocardia salmonicida]|uniref:tyrosine-type recombinase/integrase n=1 Tax=Nocardia salmonicida TaxID=53431 RepID=UPI00340447DA
MAYLSESLRLNRTDGGDDPMMLVRVDIVAFLNRLTYLQNTEQMSIHKRIDIVVSARKILRTTRQLGLAQRGEPMFGMPVTFDILDSDTPARPDDIDEGKDLPVEVMRHLCSHLDALEEANSREMRIAVELMIDTGRRPHEVVTLKLDCLERDEQGKPVLIYDNFKSNRPGRRLPILEPTAGLITDQQQRVRARFPNEPVSQLVLLPGSIRNPRGQRCLTDSWVSERHRHWVVSLPASTVPIVVEVDGTPTKVEMPFDKDRIFPYAYRHTYAQRHADAGVGVDVLLDLMDHRSMETTQVYYQVGQKRRRQAVERVTGMQFDRHGNRVWRQAQAMLDSEHLRRAIGEVAVPYGSCSEPTNVAAGGGDCPVRFRCVGCSHFSTDVSYLPDLESYLADLLRSRERLRSAFDAADEWARAESMPSDEEITRIRQLIARIHTDVDDLAPHDRAQIEDAVSVVRRARNGVVGLGLPRTRQTLPNIRPDRSA